MLHRVKTKYVIVNSYRWGKSIPEEITAKPMLLCPSNFIVYKKLQNLMFVMAPELHPKTNILFTCVSLIKSFPYLT